MQSDGLNESMNCMIKVSLVPLPACAVCSFLNQVNPPLQAITSVLTSRCSWLPPLKLFSRDSALPFGPSHRLGCFHLCSHSAHLWAGPTALAPESLSHLGNEDEDVSGRTFCYWAVHLALYYEDWRALNCNRGAWTSSSLAHVELLQFHPWGCQSIKTPGLWVTLLNCCVTCKLRRRTSNLSIKKPTVEEIVSAALPW